jgi:hypothetical protein
MKILVSDSKITFLHMDLDLQFVYLCMIILLCCRSWSVISVGKWLMMMKYVELLTKQYHCLRLPLQVCTSMMPHIILKVCVMSDASHIITVGPHVGHHDLDIIAQKVTRLYFKHTYMGLFFCKVAYTEYDFFFCCC